MDLDQQPTAGFANSSRISACGTWVRGRRQIGGIDMIIKVRTRLKRLEQNGRDGFMELL